MNKQKTIIGIDIGGTKIHAALYDAKNFRLLQEERLATNAKRGFEAILKDAVKLISILQNAQTVAIGVGVPGYIDYQKQTIFKTPNIPLKKPINLVNYCKKKLNVPIIFDNDSHCFTLAEYFFNWRGKISHMLGLSIGTGLGGGIIMNGQIYRGRNGFTAEFGHTAFTLQHELEDFVSGKASLKTLALYLGITLSNIIQIFNPEVIALGGSVAHEFKNIESEVWKVIRERTLAESSKNLKIYESKLRNPGTLGAALLAYNFFLNA